jgi:hypothetical protein
MSYNTICVVYCGGYSKLQVVVAVDRSVSTGYDSTYWNIVIKYLKQYSDAEFIFWDSNIIKYTYAQAINHAENRKGLGGTYPEVIVEYMVKNNLINKEIEMVLITDGQADVENTDRMIAKLGGSLGLSKLTGIIINTGGICNLSVCLPFGRNSITETLYYEGGIIKHSIVVSAEDIRDFDNMSSINTIDEFLLKFDAIERTTKSRLGGMDPRSNQAQSIVKTLKSLKSRILHYEAKIAEEKSKIVDDKSKLDMSLSARFERAIPNQENTTDDDPYFILSELWRKRDVPSDADWYRKIDRLISYIENELKTSGVSIIQTPSMRINDAAAAKETDVEPEDADDKLLECPISFEDSTFFMMLSSDGIDALKNKQTMDLFKEFKGMASIRDLEFCKQISNMILPPMSCETYKILSENRDKICPLTRREFGPACPLGITSSAIKAANYSIATAMTKGKLVIAPAYLFSIISYLAYNDLLPEFAQSAYKTGIIKQQYYRLFNTKVPICLNRMPGEIGFKVNLIAAFWAILAAPSLLIKEGNNPMSNVVWRYAKFFPYMKTMLEIAKTPIPEGAEKNFTINSVFLNILKKCKEPGFKNKIDSLFYQVISGETSIISNEKSLSEYLKTPTNIIISKYNTDIDLIESAICVFPSEMRKLSKVMPELESSQTIRYLCGIVRPDLKLSDVILQPGFKTDVEMPSLAFTNLSTEPDHIEINKKTCRPCCWRKKENMFWDEYLKKVVQPQSLRESLSFSIYEEFGKFVDRFEYYPTKIDFTHWLYYSHVMNKNKKPALPRCCTQYINEVFNDFADIIATIIPSEFIIRRAASMRREDRKRIECNN